MKEQSFNIGIFILTVVLLILGKVIVDMGGSRNIYRIATVFIPLLPLLSGVVRVSKEVDILMMTTMRDQVRVTLLGIPDYLEKRIGKSLNLIFLPSILVVPFVVMFSPDIRDCMQIALRTDLALFGLFPILLTFACRTCLWGAAFRDICYQCDFKPKGMRRYGLLYRDIGVELFIIFLATMIWFYLLFLIPGVFNSARLNFLSVAFLVSIFIGLTFAIIQSFDSRNNYLLSLSSYKYGRKDS